MTLSLWLAYAGVALLAIASPGPAVVLAIHNSVTHGLPAALMSSVGNIVGIGALSLAATLGLGALLHTSATLFIALKLIGALYLIWLGIKQFLSVRTLPEAAQPGGRRAVSTDRAGTPPA